MYPNYVYIIDPLPSHITVTNPSTWGIKWAQGSDQTITWTTTGDPISNVKIELAKGASYQLLAANAPNTGTFDWTIPADQEVRSDYMIAITAVGDDRIRDYGDPFAIVPPGEASVITVDGFKDAFYRLLTGPQNGYLQIPSCAYNDNGTPVDNADLSAKIWMAWDTDYLYLYEEVMDDTVSGSSANRWEEDCLELYVDPLPNDATINSVWNTRLTALSVLTPGVLADDNMNTVPDLSKLFVRRIIPGGYALELKVRWAAITPATEGVNLTVGQKFGFAIMQHDNDGRGRRQASVQWAAVLLNTVYNTPAYLGTATFLPENRLQLEAKNNITGTENPIPYNSSICTDLLCDIDGLKDGFYHGLTGPSDGFLQLRSYAYNENGRPDNDADLSAKIWTAWDEDWLYLYEEVMDDTLGADATNVWEEDCIELNFDPQPTSAANSIVQARLTALELTTPGVLREDNLSAVPEGSKYYSRRLFAGGYALEMAVRWSAIVSGSETITPTVGNVFGLAINQHDNDLRGRRQATVQWAAVLADAVWNTPTYLGTVRFLEGNKLEFSARNAITGTANPVPYDGSDYPPDGIHDGSEVPSSFLLSMNYPNPFNPGTRVSYRIETPGDVTLIVYNLLGQKVRTLKDGFCRPGAHEAEWDGLDDRGMMTGSGIYVTVLKQGNRSVSRKMMKIE
ncbi:T9SS type A sorting domain-containing protein [bacterium]|nr:T9SS type A sorting domain-containing protein [bacterium]